MFIMGFSLARMKLPPDIDLRTTETELQVITEAKKSEGATSRDFVKGDTERREGAIDLGMIYYTKESKGIMEWNINLQSSFEPASR